MKFDGPCDGCRVRAVGNNDPRRDRIFMNDRSVTTVTPVRSPKPPEPLCDPPSVPTKLVRAVRAVFTDTSLYV